MTAFVGTVRKRWRVAVSVFLLCMLGAFAYNLLAPKVYQSTAAVFVSASTSTDSAALAAGNTFAQARVQSYVEVATSPAVTDAVKKRLSLSESSSAIAGSITAVAPTNKVYIELTVRNSSPQQAASIANAVAIEFSSTVEILETPANTNESPIKLTVFRPAVVPSSPASPNPRLNLTIAFVVGAILAVAAAIGRESSDNSVKSIEELAKLTGVPTLAAVPFDKQTATVPNAFRGDTFGRRAEAYRQLRSGLQFVNIDSPPRIIAVASGLPAEGKTQTSLNIAVAMAESGKRVCLIEADLRRPRVAKLLGLVESVGMTSVLIGEAQVEDVLQNAGENLAVLVAGPPPPNPSELLTSAAFRTLLFDIAERVDVVILDSAPLLPVADGIEIATTADATLLVVRANKTHKQTVTQAVELLRNAGVEPSGTVLSMTPTRATGGSDAYYYYGGTNTQKAVSGA